MISILERLKAFLVPGLARTISARTAARKLVENYALARTANDTPQLQLIVKELQASPLAIEILLETKSETQLDSADCYLTAMIISSHPKPWLIAPTLSISKNAGSLHKSTAALQRVVGIWHKLSLDPALRPQIPWLDSQIAQMAKVMSNMDHDEEVWKTVKTSMSTGAPPGAPKALSDLLRPYYQKQLHMGLLAMSLKKTTYWQVLCAIAHRVNYTPSPHTRAQLTPFIERIDAIREQNAPADPVTLMRATLLDRLSLLSVENRNYLKSAASELNFKLCPCLEPEASLSPDILGEFWTPWLHVGLASASAAAMAVFPPPSADAEVKYDWEPHARMPRAYYSLAPLLTPTDRLQWLNSPEVCSIAPVLFELPLYAPEQFIDVPLPVWAHTLQHADVSIRPQLFLLLANVQKLAAKHIPGSTPTAPGSTPRPSHL